MSIKSIAAAAAADDDDNDDDDAGGESVWRTLLQLEQDITRRHQRYTQLQRQQQQQQRQQQITGYTFHSTNHRSQLALARHSIIMPSTP